jgi:hypothetical protein
MDGLFHKDTVIKMKIVYFYMLSIQSLLTDTITTRCYRWLYSSSA